jgi:hypothetical protein
MAAGDRTDAELIADGGPKGNRRLPEINNV